MSELAEALEMLYEPDFDDLGRNTTPVRYPLDVIGDAARKQLALMPEKCEHGQSKPHYPTGEHAPYKDFLDKALHEYHPKSDPPTYSMPDMCSGKVYEQETVEAIAEALRQVTLGNINGWLLTESRYPLLAIAVLDAINALDQEAPR